MCLRSLSGNSTPFAKNIHMVELYMPTRTAIPSGQLDCMNKKSTLAKKVSKIKLAPKGQHRYNLFLSLVYQCFSPN